MLNYNFLELIWSNQGLNCINIEVWWPIRDLIEEIQNQGPKWKGAKIKDLILNLMRFGASFHLNETVHFGKNGVVSCISLEKKKKQKRCRFERHHVSSSSPGRAENRGRRSICPLLFSSFSLSFPIPKKTRQNTLHARTRTHGLPLDEKTEERGILEGWERALLKLKREGEFERKRKEEEGNTGGQDR